MTLPSTAPLRLICLSYGNSMPSVFRDWPCFLGPDVDVIPVPRLAWRTRTRPYRDMTSLVADVTDALVDADLARSYALYGHGGGALIAYEIGCELRRRGSPEPLHLFVSSSGAPQLYGSEANHAPARRADLAVCQRYRWIPRPPIGCPVTAFRGAADPMPSAAQIAAWRECGSRSFTVHTLPGNRYFLTSSRKRLLRHVRVTLASAS